MRIICVDAVDPKKNIASKHFFSFINGLLFLFEYHIYCLDYTANSASLKAFDAYIFMNVNNIPSSGRKLKFSAKKLTTKY